MIMFSLSLEFKEKYFETNAEKNHTSIFQGKMIFKRKKNLFKNLSQTFLSLAAKSFSFSDAKKEKLSQNMHGKVCFIHLISSVKLKR